ncbi:MAG: PRC-barrel domain-containing protein [Rhodobacteraceae bacterium]|nr:PRC-barrel domain-containing protein [Paracoccaceae bacterium]
MTRSFSAALLVMALTSAAHAQTRDTSALFRIGDLPFPRSQSAAAMIGQDVVSLEGDKLGKVGDVILDEQQRLIGYVVDAGGFLGLDATPVFVPVDRMTMRIDGVAVEFVLQMDSVGFRSDVMLD